MAGGLGDAARRIREIQRHLLANGVKQAVKEEAANGEEAGEERPLPQSRMQEFLAKLDTVTKVSGGLLLPVAIYYGACTALGIVPNHLITLSVDLLSHSVGLLALRRLGLRLQENLGVSRTLTRSYQALAFFGSAVYTTSLLGPAMKTATGKTYLFMHLLNTAAYGYFLALTLAYNWDLPDPRQRKMRGGVVHWKALMAYATVMALTLYVWVSEFRGAVSGAPAARSLAMIGFMISSSGLFKGASKSAVTSIPVLSPFAAVAPLVCTTLLTSLTNLPNFSSSPAMKIYVVGLFAVSYCLLMIAYLAFLEERRHSTGAAAFDYHLSTSRK